MEQLFDSIRLEWFNGNAFPIWIFTVRLRSLNWIPKINWILSHKMKSNFLNYSYSNWTLCHTCLRHKMCAHSLTDNPFEIRWIGDSGRKSFQSILNDCHSIKNCISWSNRMSNALLKTSSESVERLWITPCFSSEKTVVYLLSLSKSPKNALCLCVCTV